MCVNNKRGNTRIT